MFRKPLLALCFLQTTFYLVRHAEKVQNDPMHGKKPQDALGPYGYDKIFKVEVAADTTVVETIDY